jgi:biotin synthase-like enzyme
MQKTSKMISRIPRVCVRLNSSSSRAAVRSDWTKEQIKEIYDMPLMDLVFRASTVHRQYFNSAEVQQVQILSPFNYLIAERVPRPKIPSIG